MEMNKPELETYKMEIELLRLENEKLQLRLQNSLLEKKIREMNDDSIVKAAQPISNVVDTEDAVLECRRRVLQMVQNVIKEYGGNSANMKEAILRILNSAMAKKARITCVDDFFSSDANKPSLSSYVKDILIGNHIPRGFGVTEYINKSRVGGQRKRRRKRKAQNFALNVVLARNLRIGDLVRAVNYLLKNGYSKEAVNAMLGYEIINLAEQKGFVIFKMPYGDDKDNLGATTYMSITWAKTVDKKVTMKKYNEAKKLRKLME